MARRPREDQGGSVGGPPLLRGHVNSVPGPRWTLDSSVRDILLRSVPPLDAVMLSECLERVDCEGEVTNCDVRMDVVIQKPELYIPDEHTRGRILSLPECQTYALVYRAAQLLRGKGIAALLQWGAPDEKADAKRAVGDELADDGLWDTVCGLLDAAFNAAKGAEARERALATPDAAAKVVPGAFESVVNAKWSHVLSGVADKPLGIRVVNGLPENAWSDAEVNRTPLQLPTENVDEERDDGFELLVLTSEKGWPFKLFGTHATANGTPFQMMHATDVVVRRESVRVWNIVRADLDAWLVRKEGCPRPSILLGSPGIGKSFGVGSHLLYELLHYAPGKLGAVAFLVHGEMYIFYLPRGGVPGRVERYTKDDGAWRIFTLSRAGCRGYMILDAKETMDLPRNLPTKLWGSIVLSSPNERNYRVWDETNRGTRFLYINRYHTREMKAYFAWMRRADLAIAEGNTAVRTELEESWRVMEGRMREVGQAPRYVFDEESYRSRKDEVEWTLNKLIASEVSCFLLFLTGKVDWKYDIAAHSLLDLVHLKSGTIERCGDRAVSGGAE